jgi:hypothetical protein
MLWLTVQRSGRTNIHDTILVGFDESYARQLCEGHFHRPYFLKRRHASALPARSLPDGQDSQLKWAVTSDLLFCISAACASFRLAVSFA